MSTPSAIIDDLGGPTRIARGLDVYPTLVSEWKRTDSIPVKHWPALIDYAKAQDFALSADALVAAHVNRQPRAAKRSKVAA
jgi:hypothetical protein